MPRQGENNPMNDSVHQMSLLVGEIKGKVETLTNSIESLNMVWGERERAATEGRRSVHEKVDAMRHDLMRFGAEVENVSRDVADIKPAIESFKTDRDRHQGAERLGRRIWMVMTGAAGLAGGAAAELFHNFRGH